MPLFRYTITCGNETRTAEIRKSNPQGWVAEVIAKLFPEITSTRPSHYWSVPLEKPDPRKEVWHGTLLNEPEDLLIHVVKIKP